jgi:hypothetical protein
MKPVGSMTKKFGSYNFATTVVDAEGRYWWFFHPPYMDLEAAWKAYGHNGPFNSQEEAEENFRVTILGPNWPNRDSSGIQRRKGR